MTQPQNQQPLKIYLDVAKLKDGARWDTGFMDGITASQIVVPIVSVGALAPMAALAQDDGSTTAATDRVDNVLMEWLATLELFSRSNSPVRIYHPPLVDSHSLSVPPSPPIVWYSCALSC